MTPVTVPIKYRGVNIYALSMENEIVIYNLDDRERSVPLHLRDGICSGDGFEDHTVFYRRWARQAPQETTEDDFSRCYIFDVSD
jgi:hypothetical protein